MIINDIDSLKNYVSTITGSNFNVFKPYVISAEDWLRDEITGEPLFELVCQKSGDDARLVQLCEKLISFNRVYIQ